MRPAASALRERGVTAQRGGRPGAADAEDTADTDGGEAVGELSTADGGTCGGACSAGDGDDGWAD